MPQFRVSAWAIRNPIAVAVVFTALTLAGVFSYLALPVKQFPNISFPAVTVTITQNGASPAELETQVTRPVEDAVAGIEGIKDVRSSILSGASITTVNFKVGEGEQRAKDDVQSAVDQIRATLPREIDEPIILPIDVDSLPILTYAVEAQALSPSDLSWFIDDTVSRAILGQAGVSQVNRVGGADREINVVVNLDRLAGFGLTVPQLNDALRKVSANASGGRLEVGNREQTVRVIGQADTEERLRLLTIPLGGDRHVRLSDLAEIGAGVAEERNFARLDGRPVVGFQVLKTKKAGDIAVEERVAAVIKRIEKAHPGVRFTKVLSTVDETRASFNATVNVLVEGMILAAMVVFLFLRDWRSTAITAAAMPLSLVPTFAAMLAFGFSLNVITLLGLTLVIGILVDDAIVEIENIEKRIERGQRPYDAALEGADAIGLAVVATTVAIIVVFAPVSAMTGIAGQFFEEFGLTVSVAVIASLAVARFVTPLLAAYFLRPGTRARAPNALPAWYRRILVYALDHQGRSVLGGVLIFLGSLYALSLLPTAFQPVQNAAYVNLTVQGPPGATRADMEEAVREATAIFRLRPEVASVFANVGGASSAGFGLAVSGGDLRSGAITVVLRQDRDLTAAQFRHALRPQLRDVTGARVNFLGDFGIAELLVTLTGEDAPLLERTAERLRREMGQLAEVRDPRPTALPAAPEVQIIPREAEMARLGVDSETLAAIARIATIGDIRANVAKLTMGERRIPIVVRLSEHERSDVDTLARLRVPLAGGGTTTLGTVADIRFHAGPAQIDRFDRRRQQTIEANLGDGVSLGSAIAAVGNLPIMRNLPTGVSQPATGDAEALAELLGMMGLVVAAGVLMLYGVMVLLFSSFFKPVAILSALPLAIGGAVVGLLVTRLDLSLPSMIGFLMLLGLAAKNSILLVEYAIERERLGLNRRDALIDACGERARPIVMTTFAMAAGMLPTAFGIGTGSEFRQPMAVAVIGGLITSTALSLVLVPVIYELVDDFERWLRPRFNRFTTPRAAPEFTAT